MARLYLNLAWAACACHQFGVAKRMMKVKSIATIQSALDNVINFFKYRRFLWCRPQRTDCGQGH